MHSLVPPPYDSADETQADNQGNDVDSYAEGIHVQVISHQLASLTGQDRTLRNWKIIWPVRTYETNATA